MSAARAEPEDVYAELAEHLRGMDIDAYLDGGGAAPPWLTTRFRDGSVAFWDVRPGEDWSAAVFAADGQDLERDLVAKGSGTASDLRAVAGLIAASAMEHEGMLQAMEAS